MIRHLVNIYRKLPIKPFRGIFAELYRKHRLLNRNRIITATRDGIKYRLDLNELIDSAIYYNGCFEPAATAIIDKYTQEGMTVLDVGANNGCHTLHFAKLVGKMGKVIAFEPMSEAILRLKCNMELNDFDNIVVEKIALSNVNKKKQSAYFRTSWTLDGSKLNIAGNKEDVDFFTLDEYVKNKRLDKIDFIKLDVDGYEYKVLSGGRNSIKRFTPIILVELGKYTLKEAGDSLEDLIDLLASLGYSFYSESDLEEYSDKESLLNAVPSDGTINVLCQPIV